MKIMFYYPRWGSEDMDWKGFCRKVKQNGFDGVEGPCPDDPAEKEAMLAALKAEGLLFIGQYYQSFEKDFEAHKASYLHHLQALATCQPVKINAQTGKDYFSFEQNAALFAAAQQVEQQTGITICHETHRNKALFAAHIARTFLKGIGGLKLTGDFSHWCNVSESLLEDQTEAMALACQHVEHLHARVGHAQSAQVIDPRLEEYREPLEAHLRWWDAVVAHFKKEGRPELTITTEFGPPPYMVRIPFTNTVIADQWAINIFMRQLLKERYAE